MSKILITGNGFDLFHGLPTKYGHFMAIMMTIEGKNFSSDVTFEELFGIHFKDKFNHDYKKLVSNFAVGSVVFDYLKINEIKDELKNNVWFKYFKTILEIETWIDFESEIFNVLELSLKHSILKNNFNDYDKKEKSQLIALNVIFERGTAKNLTYNEEFVYERKINSLVFYKKLIIDLENFTSIFNKYLVNIVSPFYDLITSINEECFNKIDKFLTFNYTNTLEKIYNVDSKKINYIHGKIHEESSMHNIILGVDSIPEELIRFKFYDFEKTFQKIQIGINDSFIDEPISGKYNDLIEYFYIIGHSLDKSDSVYINEIFRYLILDQTKNSKVVIFYYDNYDRTSKLRNLYSFIGKNDVDKFSKTKRLVFKELNEENLMEYIYNAKTNKDIYI